MENLNISENQQSRVITVKEWIIYLLLLCIPVVNIVCLIMWAFGSSDTNPSRKNWAKAQIIIGLLAFAFIFLMYLLFYSLGASMLNNA